MKKASFTFRIEEEKIDAFEKVAAASHLEPQALAALMVATFSDLKQGAALSALTSIPHDLFKGRAGRPPSGPVRPAGEGIDDTSGDYVTKSGIRIPVGKSA